MMLFHKMKADNEYVSGPHHKNCQTYLHGNKIKITGMAKKKIEGVCFVYKI